MTEYKGLIHLYYGDGKGKTTCAMGLALRCAGHGEKVVIVQFLKDGMSGECLAFLRMEQVTLLTAHPVGKFSSQMDDQERQETEDASTRTFRAATAFAVKNNVRMLVLDEICAAINGGFVEEDEVLAFLKEKPEGLEVVLTGRDPSRRLQEQADYLSEICKRRHPYDSGIAAREGIER